VHTNCARLAGTTHFILHTQSLTDEEAKKVAPEIQPRLPLQLKRASFHQKSEVAVMFGIQDTRIIDGACQRCAVGHQGPPARWQTRSGEGGAGPNAPESLSRSQNVWRAAQIQKMKMAVQGMQYGQVLATEIALKEVGSGYREGRDGYRVLAPSSARTGSLCTYRPSVTS
jgi:hypothetical protein